jgi:hypothetical protein
MTERAVQQALAKYVRAVDRGDGVAVASLFLSTEFVSRTLGDSEAVAPSGDGNCNQGYVGIQHQ